MPTPGEKGDATLPSAPSALAPVVASGRPDWYLMLRAMKEHKSRTVRSNFNRFSQRIESHMSNILQFSLLTSRK